MASAQRGLTIFGGTGQTGKKVVELALERGHRLKVLARSASGLGGLSSRVEVVEGSVLDSAAVDSALQGADAVLSALGHVKGSPRDLEAAALTNIVASMGKGGVRRLVVLASSVVGDPGDRPTFGQSFTRWLVKAFRREVYDDSLAKAKVVQGSGLDWTIVRASILTSGPATGKYRVGRMEKGMGVRVSRGDVAEFMLKCAVEGSFIRESPYISS
jgi:putative NADH-flavin reductase